MIKNIFNIFYSVVLSFFLFPAVLMASWSGQWEGKAFLKAGDVENTGTLLFVLEQTEDHLSLKEGQFSSPHYQVRWEPVTVTIKDGKLYFNDEKVGTITEEWVDVNYYDKNSKQHFQYHAERLDEKTIRYQEIWMDEDHKIIYSLQSDLTRPLDF